MPELPDIVVYIEALEKRIHGATLKRVRVASPFLLRTAVPPLSSVEGKTIVELRRLGKRICFGFEDDLWLVLHLMIAGRLHWYDDSAKAAKARGLAAFEFSSGTLTLTEAGTQKRASLHVVQGEAGLDKLNPGGLEVFESDEKEFAAALQAKNHTLKRALTDPRILSGIGNAYSDEILFNAQLSPFTLTQKLKPEEISRLFEAKLSPFTLTKKLTDNDIEQLLAAIKRTLSDWVERLRSDAKDRFPEKVTAFRPDMATHGKYGEPCPRCGSKIQRIRYGSNETNYCPTCQTGGKLLADRALSRLLKDDWPKTPEELENLTKN